VRRAEIVEADQHVRQVPRVLDVDPRDQGLRRDPLGLRLEHDGRAVRVVGTDVVAFVAAKLLKPDPDIGLYGLEDMAEMDAGHWRSKERW
jgi:hypothetical protein